MEQVLFMLRDGKISQWNLSRGKLVAATVRGQHNVPYSAETANAYWGEWKEDNMVASGDVYDAIFLSESPDDFGELPKWICANSSDKSAWTFELLSLLVSEAEYKRTGLCLVQGNVKRLIGTEKADGAIKLFLKSSLAFTLLEKEPKPKVPESKASKQSTPAVSSASGNADSYNDPKALSLKVGDKIEGTVTSVLSALNRCYIKSDKAEQLIRVKLSAEIASLPKKDKDKLVGKQLTAEVVSVKDNRVDYRVAF